nr:hypothetical protein GCM10020063_057110 [Dactylosporangium thailandense]
MASEPLKVTAVAPVNPVPVIVTVVPPAAVPVAGLTVPTTGCVETLASRGAAVPCSGGDAVVATANAPSTSRPSAMFGHDDPRRSERRLNNLNTKNPPSVRPRQWTPPPT